jgi:putative ABC transport system substrate-binding protein
LRVLRLLVSLIVLSALVATPLGAEAQNAPRIGLLSIGTDPIKPNLNVWVPFLDQLEQLGYVEGRSVVIERRFAGGRPERLPEFVADLARLHVDMVVATGDVESLAAKRAMPTTSIVMVLVPDPVAAGLVTSLARPGGNVTGLSTLAPELYAKRLELLKEVIPGVSRVGLLLNPTTAHAALASTHSASAARFLNVHLQSLTVRNPQELETVFSTISRERLQALVVVTDGVSFNQRDRIAGLAARVQVPTMCEVRDFVQAGSLMSYGPSYSDLARRAAIYVDKILKGARPADLPVEQPTKFELVINRKTAKALGLTIPPSLLLRADHVIE